MSGVSGVTGVSGVSGVTGVSGMSGMTGTPLHAGRQCWGKSILPRAGYGLGTYRTVDIFNFSLISLAILEKLYFLCFYIIKSMARKGYFGPKYP